MPGEKNEKSERKQLNIKKKIYSSRSDTLAVREKLRRRENEIEKKEEEEKIYDFHRVDSVSNVYEPIE